jgi:hypothetical protein
MNAFRVTIGAMLLVGASTFLAYSMPAIAACPSATAGAQNAGEGEGGYSGTTAPQLKQAQAQKTGEGEGGYSGTTAPQLKQAQAQKSGEGEGGYSGTTAPQLKQAQAQEPRTADPACN